MQQHMLELNHVSIFCFLGAVLDTGVAKGASGADGEVRIFYHFILTESIN